MPHSSSVANVKTNWNDGVLEFTNPSGTVLASLDGVNNRVALPVSTILLNQVMQYRGRFTVAEVNAGATMLAAIAGYKYRMVDAAMISIGGAAATATSVDILGTQAASGVKLMDARVAGLTENTLLRAGAATNGVILAAGASFVANDANTAITIGKTGGTLATATHIDVLFQYVIEAA